ncbi:MAG: hypothetical protein A2275_09760 [Bacteroidetes bacterium RIFOXYA12_FULL_35_11]|nr:MAG: hypothetical protein A2X01_02160 [Bacteroidetes bacterium GWF2_35_48]OFY82339.1 MAG: hypothetical protein A2275_09760 [Bacteroidetes bacterium RIFOXYA12_FULL_35_11]OFY94208.1 MAG: hypothetical protein A2309_07015 [Bacteroidetes bacterium RIFOXYB2_FULL_35_7]OFY97154.1 MAG: hypothetical protein A2491_07710 [Bacteroidetes bacterium RIFOXYC12_FULL_35_7]HBX49616.1 hypothetical protein [Bacteroidales bacterium]
MKTKAKTKTVLKKKLGEDQKELHTTISTLKKSMTKYKTLRKSEWKLFKTKFSNDMDIIKKTLKRIDTLHKNK